MGLFDKYKITNNRLLEWQNKIISDELTELVTPLEELRSTTKWQSEEDISIIRDCIHILSITDNPTTFFSRLETLKKRSCHLLQLKPYLRESGSPIVLGDNEPRLDEQNVIKQFLIRYLKSVSDKAKTLKTEKGRKNQFVKFHENLQQYYPLMDSNNIRFIENNYSQSVGIAPSGKFLYTEWGIYEMPDNYKLYLDYGPIPGLNNIDCINTQDSDNALDEYKKYFLGENLYNTQYDIDSPEEIRSIPVPSKDDTLYYTLQRKATEYKRNGRLDLAIECLRKSNQLSDCYDRPPLLEKDYLRLVKYLKLAGLENDAVQEEQLIYSNHPEFKDKRILSIKKITATLIKCKKWKQDLVIVETSNSCPICRKYNKKVYSISGKNQKYPKLPLEITQNGGSCTEHYLKLSIYFDGVNRR